MEKVQPHWTPFHEDKRRESESIIKPIYIRETRRDPSPNRMIAARSDSTLSVYRLFFIVSPHEMIASVSNWVARSVPRVSSRSMSLANAAALATSSIAN